MSDKPKTRAEIEAKIKLIQGLQAIVHQKISDLEDNAIDMDEELENLEYQLDSIGKEQP